LGRQVAKTPLTERERGVLELIAAGRSNEDIAASLQVTLSTVKTHIYRLMHKLAAKNRTDAVAKARQSGLLPP
jgi:ATP/maltotriose-dependent transcriptional regulator MalT